MEQHTCVETILSADTLEKISIDSKVQCEEKEVFPVRLNKIWKIYKNNTGSCLQNSSLNSHEQVLFTEGTEINLLAKNESVVPDREALLVNEFESPCCTNIYLGCGCDYRMEIRINGVVIFDCMQDGNQYPVNVNNRTVVIPVNKGTNVLSIRLISGTGGWRFVYREIARAEWNLLQIKKSNFEMSRYVLSGTAQRFVCETLIQNAVYAMSGTVFKRFDMSDSIPEDELQMLYEQYPLLEYYDKSLDKVIRELSSAEVPENGILVWHLYNMGYVIKTHTSCFGIDLHHRRAYLLEPYLDFLLVTHNHDDHYNMRLLRAMSVHKKKVISNFFAADGYSKYPAFVEMSDTVSITTNETDHNSVLKKFMTTFQMECRTQQGGEVVLFSSGDTCNAAQLCPSKPVDVYIVHPRVGLSVLEQVKIFSPRVILFSHINEMGHCKPCIYRPVAFDEPETDMEAIRRSGFSTYGISPFWGERFAVLDNIHTH